jgi:SAM-dependent methyltransferase
MKEICGDVSKTNRLTIGQKFVYFMHNLGRGVWGYLIWLPTTRINPSFVYSEITTDSPTRHMLDQAFGKVLQEQVTARTINVLDIGCGTAYLRNKLHSLGYSGEYVGIDVFREPDYTDKHEAFQSSFILTKIEDFVTEKKFNVVMSVTTLEHVEDDYSAINVANTLVESEGLQIHVVPMFPTLFLYLWHGYRQYTPRRLRNLFQTDQTQVLYYRVGGMGSFLVHFFWITLPERIVKLGSVRRRLSGTYRRFVQIGFLVDRLLPFGATAYIIVSRNK